MILKFMPSMQPLVLWSWWWWWWLYYKNQTPHILYHILNPSSLKAVNSMGEEAEPYICPAVLAPGASTVSFQTQVFTKKREEPVRVNNFKKKSLKAVLAGYTNLKSLRVLLIYDYPDLPQRGGWIAPLKRVYRCQHGLCHCISRVSKLSRAQGREGDGGEAILTGRRQTASHQMMQNLCKRD